MIYARVTPATASVYTTQDLHQMTNAQVPTLAWDNACPAGVSYTAHIMELPVRMAQAFFGSGARGVILTHPLIVSMLLAVSPAYMGREIKMDELTMDPVDVGRIGGIPIWICPAVPA